MPETGGHAYYAGMSVNPYTCSWIRVCQKLVATPTMQACLSILTHVHGSGSARNWWPRLLCRHVCQSLHMFMDQGVPETGGHAYYAGMYVNPYTCSWIRVCQKLVATPTMQACLSILTHVHGSGCARNWWPRLLCRHVCQSLHMFMDQDVPETGGHAYYAGMYVNPYTCSWIRVCQKLVATPTMQACLSILTHVHGSGCARNWWPRLLCRHVCQSLHMFMDQGVPETGGHAYYAGMSVNPYTCSWIRVCQKLVATPTMQACLSILTHVHGSGCARNWWPRLLCRHVCQSLHMFMDQGVPETGGHAYYAGMSVNPYTCSWIRMCQKLVATPTMQACMSILTHVHGSGCARNWWPRLLCRHVCQSLHMFMDQGVPETGGHAYYAGMYVNPYTCSWIRVCQKLVATPTMQACMSILTPVHGSGCARNWWPRLLCRHVCQSLHMFMDQDVPETGGHAYYAGMYVNPYTCSWIRVCQKLVATPTMQACMSILTHVHGSGCARNWWPRLLCRHVCQSLHMFMDQDVPETGGHAYYAGMYVNPYTCSWIRMCQKLVATPTMQACMSILTHVHGSGCARNWWPRLLCRHVCQSLHIIMDQGVPETGGHAYYAGMSVNPYTCSWIRVCQKLVATPTMQACLSILTHVHGSGCARNWWPRLLCRHVCQSLHMFMDQGVPETGGHAYYAGMYVNPYTCSWIRVCQKLVATPTMQACLSILTHVHGSGCARNWWPRLLCRHVCQSLHMFMDQGVPVTGGHAYYAGMSVNPYTCSWIRVCQKLVATPTMQACMSILTPVHGSGCARNWWPRLLCRHVCQSLHLFMDQGVPETGGHAYYAGMSVNPYTCSWIRVCQKLVATSTMQACLSILTHVHGSGCARNWWPRLLCRHVCQSLHMFMDQGVPETGGHAYYAGMSVNPYTCSWIRVCQKLVATPTMQACMSILTHVHGSGCARNWWPRLLCMYISQTFRLFGY